MFKSVLDYCIRTLKKLEPYAKTDMVYFAKSAFWLNLNSAFGIVASLIISVLFAHYVEKDVYGIYRYILSVAGLAAAFSLTGMNSAVLRATAQGFNGTFRRSITEQIRWAWPQFLFSLAAAGYYFFNANNLYGFAFLIISVAAPISTIANTYNYFLLGKKDFRTSAFYGIASNALYFVAICAVIMGMPQSFVLMVAAYYIANMSANVFFSLRTYKKYKKDLDQGISREEDMSFGKHLSLMNIIGTLATQAENIIVYYLLGPVALALYSFATMIPERIRTVFGFISSAASPKIAEKELHPILPNLRRKTWQLILIAVCISLAYILTAPYIFRILFPQYESVVIYSQVFSLSLIAIASNISLTTLLSHRKQKELYYVSLGVPIAKIIATAAGIWYLGIWGAIFAKMFHHFLLLASTSYYLYRKPQ